ncbi:hypothetical protein AB0J57_21155 [Streptomyces sp. NPDC049837]|uniref:hypothetical protein n=1 Tax=Streptomyces sp. NPDC049837 TaxID=3155277 RepID=UPI003445C6F2
MEALTKLADAVGQPSPAAVEKAKALFPFIAQESELREAGTDDREPVAVSECGKPESHG